MTGVPASSHGGGLTAIANTLASGDNSGDATTTSASFVDVGKGLSGSIAAAVGDVLLVVMQAQWKSSVIAGPGQFRVLATTGTHTMGNTSLTVSTTAAVQACATVQLYTVVSGDISGGNVAFKLQYASDGAATLTVVNSGSNLARIAVANLLH